MAHQDDVEEASLINEAGEVQLERKSNRTLFLAIIGAVVGAACIGSFAVHKSKITSVGIGDGEVQEQEITPEVAYAMSQSNAVCDSTPLSDTPVDTLAECQEACQSNCGSIFFKNDAAAKVAKVCKTFATCGKTIPDIDGYSVLMTKLPTCLPPGDLTSKDLSKIGVSYRSTNGEMIARGCLTEGVNHYYPQAVSSVCSGVPLAGDAGSTAIAPHSSQVQCENLCDNNPNCNFYMWKDQPGTQNQYNCKLFAGCDILLPPADGLGIVVFIKPSALPGYTLIGNSQYCQNSLGKPSELMHEASDTALGKLTAASMTQCKSKCDSDPLCKFYMFKDDKWAKVHRECITFSSCEKRVSYLPYGQSLLFAKNGVALPPAPAPATPAPTPQPTPPPGQCTSVTLNTVNWCKTTDWDCGGCDISEHEVPVDAAKGLAMCALHCLKEPKCEAFNIPHPGDGFCYTKGPVLGCSKGDSQNMGAKKCGVLTKKWDYYTLQTARNKINVMEIMTKVLGF